MQFLKPQMPSARNAKREHYMYTVGVFAAVCVLADLLVSCLSHLSEVQVQNTIFAIAVTVSAFIAGSVSAGREATHANAVQEKKVLLPAKKFAQTKGVACRGEHEARHGTASPVQAAHPAGPPPAEPAAEAEASQGAQSTEPRLGSPQEPLKGPRHDPCSSPGAQISTEIEGTTNWSPRGEEIGQPEIDASAACGCTADDMVGLADESGSARPSPVDATISQNDPTCDDREETSAADGQDVLPTAAERTPLRSEASTFVPTCWKDPAQMPSEVSQVCIWAPCPPPGLCDEFPQMAVHPMRHQNSHVMSNGVPEQFRPALFDGTQLFPPPGLYDEFPQMAMQQWGSQRDDRTTVMLRNLPWNFYREDLIKEMDAKGFAGLYDFVYMPLDFKTRNCMGYAFANLVTSEEARRFMLAFDGFNDWPRRSSKICAVGLSRTQGLEANILRHQNSPVMSDEVPDKFRPVLFSGTQRVPFPEATRELPEALRNPLRR